MHDSHLRRGSSALFPAWVLFASPTPENETVYKCLEVMQGHFLEIANLVSSLPGLPVQGGWRVAAWLER